MKTTKAPAKQEKVEAAPDRQAAAYVKYLRIAPRKIRLVIDAIRRKTTGEAFQVLMAMKKKGARITEKLLKSAVANAKVLGMDVERLYVSEARADGGPILKRIMSRSMGRADRIAKRTTHLTLKVREGAKKVTAQPVLPAKGTSEGKIKPPKDKKNAKSRAAAGTK